MRVNHIHKNFHRWNQLGSLQLETPQTIPIPSAPIKGKKKCTRENQERSNPSRQIENAAKSPRTGGSAGHIVLHLDGQAEKSIEAVKGDVGHVADVAGPPDLHLAEPPAVALACDPRFPEDGEEQRQERELIPSAAAAAIVLPPGFNNRVDLAVREGTGVRSRWHAGKRGRPGRRAAGARRRREGEDLGHCTERES